MNSNGHLTQYATLSRLQRYVIASLHTSCKRQRSGSKKSNKFNILNIFNRRRRAYTKLEPAQAHHFFELVTARYEHGSIILTSNTSFAGWGNLLGDEVLATALLDRILPPAAVIPLYWA